MPNHDSLLSAAERVAGLLADRGIDAVVIGAAALAAHRYVRQTEDIDLGVNVAVRELDAVAVWLREAGYEVEVREPDGQDLLVPRLQSVWSQSTIGGGVVKLVLFDM